jgi:hypothetical protein
MMSYARVHRSSQDTRSIDNFVGNRPDLSIECMSNESVVEHKRVFAHRSTMANNRACRLITLTLNLGQY